MTQRMVVPPVTTAERNALTDLQKNDLVFNTDTNQFNFTLNTGITWQAIADISNLLAYLPLSGGSMSGDIDMGGYSIISVLSLGVDSIQMVGGNINCDTQQINNVGDPLIAQDASTKNYVDTNTVNIVLVSGTSIAMIDTSVTNRYVLQNSSPCTLTLPTTITAGHAFEIVGGGTSGWIISQNSGQTIQLGASTTTSGVSGSLASTLQTDSLILTCNTTDTQLTAYGVQGNISIF